MDTDRVKVDNRHVLAMMISYNSDVYDGLSGENSDDYNMAYGNDDDAIGVYDKNKAYGSTMTPQGYMMTPQGYTIRTRHMETMTTPHV